MAHGLMNLTSIREDTRVQSITVPPLQFHPAPPAWEPPYAEGAALKKKKKKEGQKINKYNLNPVTSLPRAILIGAPFALWFNPHFVPLPWSPVLTGAPCVGLLSCSCFPGISPSGLSSNVVSSKMLFLPHSSLLSL